MQRLGIGRLAVLATLAVLTLLAAACASGPAIDRTHGAVSQGSRAQYLILHFTLEDWAGALEILTAGPVSSHYLVRDDPPTIYQLVDESRRAFHAGVSGWRGHTNLNAASIGIEIVNAGNRLADRGTPWQPYPDAQIDAVLELVRWIVARHGIAPENILGHSDIAPQRKIDPGPLFPWRRLADEGLIRWPDDQRVAERRAIYEAAPPDVAWLQQSLARHGFEIIQTGVLDEQTRRVVAAFQMKYRPARYDGEPDAETCALLDVLNTAP